MKFITIGGLPGAGKTYTGKLIAQHNNYLALEFEKLRWDFFNANPEKNLYKYTQHLPILENENMREYYLRCALYENRIPLESMVEWHKNTMKFIGENLCKIIDEAKLIRTEKDYMNFCSKYTKLINYFHINKNKQNEFILVDLPGYGYSQAGKTINKTWATLIENYLINSKNLKGIFILVDIRHEPNELDLIMVNYLHKNLIPFYVIATKSDKIAKSKINNRIKTISKVLKIAFGNILVCNKNGVGRDEILNIIDNALNF